MALDMFIAALILVLSVAALAQFGLFYWRALLVSTAAEPLSDSLREATGHEEELGAQQFPALLALRELCPDLEGGKENWRGVRAYYGFLSLMKAAPLPAVKQWADAEQSLCSRYAAVLLDRRLQANAQLRLSMNQQ